MKLVLAKWTADRIARVREGIAPYLSPAGDSGESDETELARIAAANPRVSTPGPGIFWRREWWTWHILDESRSQAEADRLILTRAAPVAN